MSGIPIWGESNATFGEVEFRHVAHIAFNDAKVEAILVQALSPYFERMTGLGNLIEYITLFLNQAPDDVFVSLKRTRKDCIETLTNFTHDAEKRNAVYSKHSKPNPDGVFWPHGDDFKAGEVLPFTQKTPIMDKDTAIGAAGSCFAEEFSYAMQEKGFNYIVTEPLADGENGVVNANVQTNPDMSPSSANWGILFNLPSFTQLAERAFGVRTFKKMLALDQNNAHQDLYLDPYREGIFFSDPDAFEHDYALHLAAVRKAFETCEVFVITPGLSECWEYVEDGSILSRNPRSESLRALCRPKVLSLQDNIEALQRFIDIVRQHNPTIKFIISVSPVPFLATTRGDEMHVVEANSLSKATLRLAVDQVVRDNEDVFYFPSYELVTSCIDDPWEDDRRHVKRSTVEKVVSLFETMFVQT